MISAEIKKLIAAWEGGALKKSLGRSPERREEFQTVSGEPVERVYMPDSGIEKNSEANLNMPGCYPFTRGAQPTMYRGRFWTMRQYAGFSTAEESNQRFRYLLDQGSTGLSVAFDLPTQIGLDSDQDLCVGEVGKVGVAVDSLADMELLFAQIPLDKVSTSMTINSPAAVLLAMYIVMAEKQGVAPDRIRGTIQNDVLKEYVARGTYIFPPGPGLRLISNIFAYCTEHVPNWNTISISGYHIREAGATAAEEVAFTLADAVCYVEAALKAGLVVDDFARRLSFFFAAHTDVLEEVAKFRAARRLYARIMKERFKAQDPKSMVLRFHTQTGGVTLTAQQPENNIVRVTLQALAAVLGGTQSLHTNSMDEALALPAEKAVTIALRTQQVIAHESGVTNTVDPLGGSFAVEAMTDRIEAEAEKIMAEIDQLGGMETAIEEGFVQRRIERSAYAYGRSVEDKERIVVGVNQHVTEGGPEVEVFRVSEEVRRRQVDRLAKVRAQRNESKVAATLKALDEAAKDEKQNLMPPIIDAVREYVTIGEICSVLRERFGEYQESFKF